MKIVGVNFDHMHMGDLLRMAHEQPRAEIAGICDEEPERMRTAATNFSIPPDRVFTDYRQCLERTKPDLAILCPATARHAEYVEKVAPNRSRHPGRKADGRLARGRRRDDPAR